MTPERDGCMTPLTLCELKVGILVDGQLISLFSMVEAYI
jgi:hypothetical protein